MKVPKKYGCIECKKQYCYMKHAQKHAINKHNGIAKFRFLTYLDANIQFKIVKNE